MVDIINAIGALGPVQSIAVALIGIAFCVGIAWVFVTMLKD